MPDVANHVARARLMEVRTLIEPLLSQTLNARLIDGLVGEVLGQLDGVMTNEELVRLVTDAFDAGFLAGYLYSDYAEGEPRDRAMLLDGDYIGKRDEWVRGRVSKGTILDP